MRLRPRRTKGVSLKARPPRYAARLGLGASASKALRTASFATSPLGSNLCSAVAAGWLGCHERITRYCSLQGKSFPVQMSRYIALCRRPALAVQCLAWRIYSIWGVRFPLLFMLQASPYDTRNLANPKDVMPFLPEACGDICQVLSPWPGCGKPANEAERLAATEKLQLIGKEPHPALQRYVDLISTCYQVRHQDLPGKSAKIQGAPLDLSRFICNILHSAEHIFLTVYFRCCLHLTQSWATPNFSGIVQNSVICNLLHGCYKTCCKVSQPHLTVPAATAGVAFPL